MMIRLASKTIRVAFLLPLLFLVTDPASAEYKGRTDSAWEHAGEMIDGSMSELQKSKLIFLAYHGAADLMCENLAIDRLKFDDELASMQHDNVDDLSDKEHAFYHDRVLIHYGMAVGIMLAEHAGDKEAFCKEAIEARDDPEGGTLFDTTTEADYEPEEDGLAEPADD